MPFNSRIYASLILGGIALICLVCLVGRWRMLSESTEPVLLGPKSGERYLSPAAALQLPFAAVADSNESGQAGPGSPTDDEAKGQPADTTESTRININSASAAELDELPGIGPVLAQRIIEHRNSYGDYGSVQELQDVEGIGETTLERIADLISTGE